MRLQVKSRLKQKMLKKLTKPMMVQQQSSSSRKPEAMTKLIAKQLICKQLAVPSIEVLGLSTPDDNVFFAVCIDRSKEGVQKQAAADPLDSNAAREVYEKQPKQFAVKLEGAKCCLISDADIEEAVKTWPKLRVLD